MLVLLVGDLVGGLVPRRQYLGVVDDAAQVRAAEVVADLGRGAHRGLRRRTVLAQELHGPPVLRDVLLEDLPLLPAVGQLRLEPELDAAAAEQHLGHPMDALPSQHDDDVAVLVPAAARREAVHAPQEEAEDVGAAAAVEGAPASDDDVGVVDEDDRGRRGLRGREDLDDVGVQHHLAHAEELALHAVREPAADGGLARAGLPVDEHPALRSQAEARGALGVLQREEDVLLQLLLDALEPRELGQVHGLHVLGRHGEGAHELRADGRQHPLGVHLRGRGGRGRRHLGGDLAHERHLVDLRSHSAPDHRGVVRRRGLAQRHAQRRLREGQLRVLDRREDEHPARGGRGVAQGLQQHGRPRAHLPIVGVPRALQRADQRAAAPQGLRRRSQVQVVDDGDAVLLEGLQGGLVDHAARRPVLSAAGLHRGGDAEQRRAAGLSERAEDGRDAVPSAQGRRGAELHQRGGAQPGHREKLVQRLVLGRRQLQRHRNGSFALRPSEFST
mmetsp:Transcript_5231/g.14175  ORF Transcript_5231/g.14175 Transcript_5231/m.14175 type:complete len:501 (-) Transcript_5231:30-1532(-)